MNEAIKDLFDNLVEVRSISGQGVSVDQGILIAFDYPWVRLDKKGEVLCFPVHNIRLMKLVKRLHEPAPEDMLLRPIDEEEKE